MPSNPAHKSEETRASAKAKPKPVQTQAAPQRAAAPPEAVQRALADPLGAGPGEILALQQTIGNRAVNKLLASAVNPADPPPSGSGPRVQFKLAVGPAGDMYEQEADRVAESVLRMPAPVQRVEEEEPVQRQPVVQRAPEDQDEEDEPMLRRLFGAQRDPAGDDGQNGGAGDDGKPNGRGAPLVQRGAAPPADPRAGFEVGGDVERQITGSAGGGKPLPESTRAFMEPRFGADFSSVRVHTGGAASQLNRQLSAQAFTRGADIYFDAGKYNPGTTAGNRLLAHELTHVVQQGAAKPNRQSSQVSLRRKPAAQRFFKKIANFFKKLFGKKKKKDDFTFQVVGGRSAKPMVGGPLGSTLPPPPRFKPDFFLQPHWAQHFLEWAQKDERFAAEVTPALVQVFVESQKRLPTNTHITVESSNAFIDEVLEPNQGDPQVAKLIAGYSGQFTLGSMRERVAAENFDKKVEGGPPSGRKVMENLVYKIGMAIHSPWAVYMEWQQTPQGRQDRPLPPEPTGETPSVQGQSERQREYFKKLQEKAEQDAEVNAQKAKEKLRQCGVPEEELDTTLAKLVDYLRDSPITLNFTAGHNEFSFFEKMGGRTPIWMKPTDKLEGVERETHMRHLQHRQKVEQKYFGFEDNPMESGLGMDRPVYGALNPGSSVKGGAEQYGTSYLVMKESVKERTTYSHKDTFASTEAIENIGTASRLEGVIADMNVSKLKELLAFALGQKGARGLGENEYIEVHLHGSIDWRRDVEKIVIDRNTVPEGSKLDEHLLRFARRYGLKVEYYNRSKWEAMALDKGLSTANIEEGPKPGPGGQPEEPPHTEVVKVGAPEERLPGTLVQVEVEPETRTALIEEPIKVEPESPVTVVPHGKVSELIKFFGGSGK